MVSKLVATCLFVTTFALHVIDDLTEETFVEKVM